MRRPCISSLYLRLLLLSFGQDLYARRSDDWVAAIFGFGRESRCTCRETSRRGGRREKKCVGLVISVVEQAIEASLQLTSIRWARTSRDICTMTAL